MAAMEPRFIPNLNTANSALQNEVHDMERDVAQLGTEFNHAVERVGVMNDHLKNVNQELQQTRSLCEARKREVETDNHMKILAEQEEGRIVKEMNRLEAEVADLKQQMNTHQNDMYKSSRKASDLKSEMDTHDQAVKEWMEEAHRRDADAHLLQKYAVADDARTKDLQLKMERAEDNCTEKHRQLEKEVTESITTQIALDKTAEQFRRAQVEREEMIKQWEATLQQMKRRDDEIDSTSLRVADQKAIIDARNMELTEKQWFMQQELENNKEQQRAVQYHEKSVAKVRLDMQHAETARQQLADELETLKFTVDRIGSDERATRAEVSRLKQDLAEKKRRLALIQEQCDRNRDQLEISTIRTLDSETTAQDVEVLIAQKEESLRQLQKELDKQHGVKFKRSQDLFDLRRSHDNVKAELQGSKFAYRNLGSKLRKVDDGTRKQAELIYTQDFTIQHLESKVSRLEGERTTDEKVLLNKQIEELKVRYEDQKTIQSVLSTQLKKINEDVRRLTTDLEKYSSEKEGLQVKLHEIELHNGNGERELKKCVNNKQDLQVERNILKLSLRNRRKTMNARVDQVMTLESRQMEMHTTMSERRMEVRRHKELLETDIRSIQSEKGRLSLELHERESRIDKLRKRFEIRSVQMLGAEAQAGGNHVQLIIKKAQQKEELQRTGDSLDSKIRKGEKEIIAMENTLKLLGQHNQAYRKSLNPVQPSDKEATQVDRLQGQLDSATEKFKVKKKQLQEVSEDEAKMKQNESAMMMRLTALIEEVGALKTEHAYAKKEKDDQADKKDRAERMVAKAKKDLRQKGRGDLEEMERDILAREIRDFNLSIMQSLGKLAKEEMEMTDSIHLLCSQAELPAPPAPVASGGSRSSSLASSRASSIASDRSSRSSSLSSSRSSVASSSSSRVTKIAFAGDGQSASRAAGGRGSTGSLRRSSSRSSSSTPISSARSQSRKS